MTAQSWAAAHTSQLIALAFSRDGELLATAGWDRTLALWSLDDLEPVARWPLEHNANALAFGMRTKSLRRIITERGQDPDDVFAEIAEDIQRLLDQMNRSIAEADRFIQTL